MQFRVVVQFPAAGIESFDALVPPDTETVPKALLVGLAVVTLSFAALSGWSMLKTTRLRKPNMNWNAPNWSTEPFSGPARFLHAGGWAFVALGLTALLTDATKQGIFFGSVLPMMAIPFGAGLLIGLHIYFVRS